MKITSETTIYQPQQFFKQCATKKEKEIIIISTLTVIKKKHRTEIICFNGLKRVGGFNNALASLIYFECEPKKRVIISQGGKR